MADTDEQGQEDIFWQEMEDALTRLSGASAFVRHTRAREQLWPLRDHWADNSRGRSAPTPSLVCHFELDAPLRADPVAWEDYQDEIALWDALSGDGLEHEIAWYPQRE